MSSNSSFTESLDRFFLVSSFYGPGNIISWLCTLASVLITWCFNVEYRRQDTISTDFVFALAIPAVAAGHLIYLLFFVDDSLGEYETATEQQLFTSQLPAIIKRAAAIEAR